MLRAGKQEHRRASRLSSQTRATLGLASRQLLASEAHRQELEAAEWVRDPHAFSSWSREPAGSRSSFSFPPAPQKDGAGLSQMERQIRESRTSLEKDIKALLELLARLGKETPRPGPGPLGPWHTSGIFL